MKHLCYRKFAGLVSWLLIAALEIAYFGTASAAEPIELRSATKAGSYRRVRALVSVEGKLKLNADGQEVKHLPIKAEGEVQYAERVLYQSKQRLSQRAVRDYQVARAKIRLHETDLGAELRPDRRLMVADSTAAVSVVFSPQGPLTREELELVEIPASKLAVEALLPEEKVSAGSRWTLSEGTVANLLGLEAVSQHEVIATVESIQDNVAILSFTGKVSGAVGGVSSDIDVKGKLNFDLKLQAVTWLTVACKENRAIGHAQPGFEVVTTLRMVLSPTAPVAELNDRALDGLSLQAAGSLTQIELTAAEAGFQLIHDRRWSVMLDRAELTVLRFVDRGDLIAQCNLSPLPPLKAGEQLALEGFQEDVKRVLGKNFEQLAEAGEEMGENGLRLLRVVVSGQAGGLPIRWTYYHLSDAEGRRASLVFTLEESLLERFAHIDRELIGNFRFQPTGQPTPAETAETGGR